MVCGGLRYFDGPVLNSLVYLIKQKLNRKYSLQVTTLNFQQVILVTNRP